MAEGNPGKDSPPGAGTGVGGTGRGIRRRDSKDRRKAAGRHPSSAGKMPPGTGTGSGDQPGVRRYRAEDLPDGPGAFPLCTDDRHAAELSDQRRSGYERADHPFPEQHFGSAGASVRGAAGSGAGDAFYRHGSDEPGTFLPEEKRKSCVSGCGYIS